MDHILPASYSHSPEEIKRLNEYYDVSTCILQRLKDLKTSVAAYDTSVANMERYHTRLLAFMPSASGFDLGQNGIILISSQSEISNLIKTFFVEFRNPSLASSKDGLTSNLFHHNYNLDAVSSPSDQAALRQDLVQVCIGNPNVEIVSDFLSTLCILWRQEISRSEFDEDLIDSVQRSWRFEQTQAVFDHRKLITYDENHISNSQRSAIQRMLPSSISRILL